MSKFNKDFVLPCLIFLFSFLGIAQTNLITNGDFENWTGDNPDNWTTTIGSVTRNQSDFSSGLSSTQIFNATTAQDAHIESDSYSLEGGKTYLLRLDVKMTFITGSNTTGIPSISMQVDAASGQVFGDIATHQTDTWEPVQFVFEAPQNDNYKFTFRIATSSVRDRVQDILIDNVRLFDAAEVPENTDDRNALIALFNATDGANWQNSWDLNQAMIYWDGITQDDSGRVTKVKLRANNLIGFLPPEIGNLTELQILDLTKTGFSGQLPNQISGIIPPEIGNLTKLKEIHLSSFEISGNLPPEMGQMAQLELLWLSNNNLTGSIPAEFGNLTNLKNLYLENNQLSGAIPTELGSLTGLVNIILANNNLSGSIPTSLGQMTNLSYLDFSSNDLTGGIPGSLGQLPNIKTIDLGTNNLGGSIPAQLSQLTTIENLYIDRNSLTGTIPAELSGISSLSRFRANSNSLQGELPVEFGALTNLTELNLAFNQLSGSIPASYGQLSNLNTLWLSRNQLSGNIPAEIGLIPSLEVFRVDRNNLSGEIPSFVNTLGALWVYSNSFVFDDLKNTSLNQPLMSYSPQPDVGISESISVEENQMFSISVTETTDENNTYQWRKDQINIQGATEATFTIANVVEADAGQYDCLINNTVLNLLELTKKTTFLTVASGDDDNDGVNNVNDSCPATPVGETVDSNGCSQSQLDDDNDGVNNVQDQCPNTPTGNTVNAQGCIIDNSGQVNYLQNFSFEDWSGNPESPNNWAITQENSFAKTTEATDGNYSLQLDLNDEFSTTNQTSLSTRGVNVATLETDKTYTISFDYKVQTGNTISARVFILRDFGSYTVQHDDDFAGFNDDGNWHTYSYDFTTNSTDTAYIVELAFRARNAPTNIMRFDNFRILGEAIPDGDQDGVADVDDLCPNTAADVLAVDENGCEIQLDLGNLLADPSFEDWSLNSGTNLRDWGLVLAGSWQKNSDISDDLQYSLEKQTSSTGFGGIFQSDIEVYKNVTYTISVDYKVIEGSFNAIEFELTRGIFDIIETFNTNTVQSGWATYTTTFTAPNTENIQLDMRVYSDQGAGKILLDNAVFRVAVDQSTLDDDNDGVTNNNDNCPNTPPNTAVDTNGCSTTTTNDTDNDGVNDGDDACPNTPAGETVDANGCAESQLDNDNDGVNNNIDLCPGTPTGEVVNAIGCSENQLDDDNDGVTNNIDLCPATPTGEVVNANGCAESQLDDDNDGVTNENDSCPNTPTGETVDSNGCSTANSDTDNDGVPNAIDQCPETLAGEIVDVNGCSEGQLIAINNEAITVKVISTTCQDTANGQIAVSFSDSFTYQVSASGPSFNENYTIANYETGLSINNLLPGTYELCVTVAESSTFERCFTVELETPGDFSSGKIVVNGHSKTGKMFVSGSTSYEVLVNGQTHFYSFESTDVNEISFDLKEGRNTILAKTDKVCQGSIAETVFMNSFSVFPNPSIESVTIYGLENSDEAFMVLSNLSGETIRTQKYRITNNSLNIEVETLPAGVYIVHIKSTNQDVLTKIIKK